MGDGRSERARVPSRARAGRPCGPQDPNTPGGMERRDALMASGFEILGHSRALQAHWARRLGAYAVDTILVLLPTWAALRALGSSDIVLLAIASGVVHVVYGTIAEAFYGRTLGKHAFALEVRTVRGSLTVRKAAARSAPKFFWYVFPLLDAILGLVGQGDPRQRFSDRALGTTVVWGGGKARGAGGGGGRAT